MGPDVLPLQRCRVPLRRLLHREHLERTEEPWKLREAVEAGG